MAFKEASRGLGVGDDELNKRLRPPRPPIVPWWRGGSFNWPPRARDDSLRKDPSPRADDGRRGGVGEPLSGRPRPEVRGDDKLRDELRRSVSLAISSSILKRARMRHGAPTSNACGRHVLASRLALGQRTPTACRLGKSGTG